MHSDKLKSLAVDLLKIDAIKFGEYKTKVGLMTPVYVDLRVLVSYPKVLECVSTLIMELSNKLQQHYDLICGVPYTALPIASVISMKSSIPMVMRRKEAKDYGTKKLIEGKFNQGDSCLIIEDVVTSGSSILETTSDLINCGLKVTDVIVLLDRQQGGKAILESRGIKMHSLLSLTELMGYLLEAKMIEQNVVDKVSKYIKETQVDVKDVLKTDVNRLKMSYQTRANLAKNAVSKKLFEIMTLKETNLCVAADLTKTDEILNLADRLGPYICIFKTHIDIVIDYSQKFIDHLKQIANKHNFLIMEDRKFSDIGNTVSMQYTEGTFQISTWADLVTAHSLSGPGVIDGLKQADELSNKGIFLLAEMSATENLITESYVKATLKMAADNAEFVAGIVCQNPLFLDQPGFIQLTPGVQLNASGDNLGQQYNSPEKVVIDNGADVAVVGRGIIAASKPVEAAMNYRELLWKAYLKRI